MPRRGNVDLAGYTGGYLCQLGAISLSRLFAGSCCALMPQAPSCCKVRRGSSQDEQEGLVPRSRGSKGAHRRGGVAGAERHRSPERAPRHWNLNSARTLCRAGRWCPDDRGFTV